MALALAAAAQAAILVEGSTPQQSRFLKLKEDVYSRINAEITAKNLGALNIKTIADSCSPTYDPKNPEERLSICTSRIDESSNTMTLEFRSPNNHFVLEFSNIDVNDPLSDIKIEPYLTEFLDSLSDLALNVEDRKKSIQSGINKAATALGIADIAVTDDKITYTYKGKQNTVSYKIAEDLVEFNTDFFQDTIDLNIPQKQFIEFETEKTMKEVFDHLFGIQRFTLGDGETAAQSIKTLDCNKLIKDPEMVEAFKTRMEGSQLGFADEGESLSVSKGAQKVTITCKTIPVGDFNLLEVNADFSLVSPSIEPVVQTYPEKSLYNLQPVSVAYFHDLGKLILQLLADFNKEDNFEPISTENAAAGPDN